MSADAHPRTADHPLPSDPRDDNLADRLRRIREAPHTLPANLLPGPVGRRSDELAHPEQWSAQVLVTPRRRRARLLRPGAHRRTR